MDVEPVGDRCPLFPILVKYPVHISRRMCRGPFEGHHVVRRFGSGGSGIAFSILEPRSIDGRSLRVGVRGQRWIRKRIFAAPLVIESFGSGLRAVRSQGPEVAIHKDGSRSVGLGRGLDLVIHRPDMPRPYAYPAAVEKTDHGITAGHAGSEDDTSVAGQLRAFDDRASDRARFPEDFRLGSRKSLRDDIRRCTAVAHRRSVERIGGIQFRRDIAVGRAPVVERPGIDREFREDRGFGRGRNVGIRSRGRKPCLVVGCRIPSLEAVSGFGYGCQRASLFMAQDDPVVRQERRFSVIQRSGDGYRTVSVFSRRGVNIYVETVGEAVSDVERLCKSRIILDRDGIDHLRIDRRIDSRSVVHAEDIGAGLFRKRKVAAFAYGRAVQTERSGVALRDTDTSPKRQGCGVSVDLHSEHLKRIVGAISAGRVFFVSVMHIDGIAANAGIYLAVTQDRDIEPVMRVGPDIEIRGVVSSEVNIISQYFRPAHGADQKIRGIRGGIFRVLLTLVGNGRHHALHIG